MDQICPKKAFPLEIRKSVHHHWIPHTRLSLRTKFHFKQTILKFGAKFAQKRHFLPTNGKTKYHHWIVHIYISLSTYFQPKVTILIFWTKFAQKRYLRFKRKKIALLRASMAVTYFLHGGRQAQRYFDVSSSSPRHKSTPVLTGLNTKW